MNKWRMYAGLKTIHMLSYEEEKSGEIQLLMNYPWCPLLSSVLGGRMDIYLLFYIFLCISNFRSWYLLSIYYVPRTVLKHSTSLALSYSVLKPQCLSGIPGMFIL